MLRTPAPTDGTADRSFEPGLRRGNSGHRPAAALPVPRARGFAAPHAALTPSGPARCHRTPAGPWESEGLVEGLGGGLGEGGARPPHAGTAPATQGEAARSSSPRRPAACGRPQTCCRGPAAAGKGRERRCRGGRRSAPNSWGSRERATGVHKKVCVF